MWDFLPMEQDQFVSAEDDAVRCEMEKENKTAVDIIDKWQCDKCGNITHCEYNPKHEKCKCGSKSWCKIEDGI